MNDSLPPVLLAGCVGKAAVLYTLQAPSDILGFFWIAVPQADSPPDERREAA